MQLKEYSTLRADTTYFGISIEMKSFFAWMKNVRILEQIWLFFKCNEIVYARRKDYMVTEKKMLENQLTQKEVTLNSFNSLYI